MPDWTISIRDPQPADEPAWRELWAGYNAFYETVVPERVTALITPPADRPNSAEYEFVST